MYHIYHVTRFICQFVLGVKKISLLFAPLVIRDKDYKVFSPCSLLFAYLIIYTF